MIVTKQDLNGYITNFPIEIVQKMVDYQVEQGRKADPSVFARNLCDGFKWRDTPEGSEWWSDVIGNKNFNRFFELYPRRKTEGESFISINKNKSLKLNFKL